MNKIKFNVELRLFSQTVSWNKITFFKMIRKGNDSFLILNIDDKYSISSDIE